MEKLTDYLITHHKEDIFEILKDDMEEKHFSINVNFTQLFEKKDALGRSLLTNFESTLSRCSIHLQNVQKILSEELGYGEIKKNVHLRVFSLPACSELNRNVFPGCEDLELFLQVTGTVIRTSVRKILECRRAYKCTKCKNVVEIEADFYQKYLIQAPRRCKNPDCKSTGFIIDSEKGLNTCKDYQEVKIQEQISQAQFGCLPNSLWVILEDDLVDSCKPGDAITICGVVKRQFKPVIINKKIEVQIVIKANHIQVNNDSLTLATITPASEQYFTSFWKFYQKNPLKGRDVIVRSFCPHIYGLHLVKLAVLITLAGGSKFDKKNDSNVKTRSEPHILLVGDPGTAKSQFLRAAAKIIKRSILTTGVGSTAAGLTVTAIKEANEWQLEAGALVLSDGGVCCIDEFNSMKEHDRTSIHEAMEQQSISVAKAGIVCKLKTRCSILAATNPKGTWDSNHPLTINIGLPSPLLSRFDLVFILRDNIDKKWDEIVAKYILNDCTDIDCKEENLWDIEMLQAYFITIKKINPVLTENSNKILAAYYQFQRRALTRNKARTTVRLLDSLIRLSQAHAKLMFHDEVEVLDAIMAVVLIETSMQNESSILSLNLDIRKASCNDPDKIYLEIAEIVLQKLELFDILQEELENFKRNCSQNSDDVSVLKSDETSEMSGELWRKLNRAFCKRKESSSIVYKRIVGNESKSLIGSFNFDKGDDEFMESEDFNSENVNNKTNLTEFDVNDMMSSTQNNSKINLLKNNESIPFKNNEILSSEDKKLKNKYLTQSQFDSSNLNMDDSSLFNFDDSSNQSKSKKLLEIDKEIVTNSPSQRTKTKIFLQQFKSTENLYNKRLLKESKNQNVKQSKFDLNLTENMNNSLLFNFDDNSKDKHSSESSIKPSNFDLNNFTNNSVLFKINEGVIQSTSINSKGNLLKHQEINSKKSEESEHNNSRHKNLLQNPKKQSKFDLSDSLDMNDSSLFKIDQNVQSTSLNFHRELLKVNQINSKISEEKENDNLRHKNFLEKSGKQSRFDLSNSTDMNDSLFKIDQNVQSTSLNFQRELLKVNQINSKISEEKENDNLRYKNVLQKSGKQSRFDLSDSIDMNDSLFKIDQNVHSTSLNLKRKLLTDNQINSKRSKDKENNSNLSQKNLLQKSGKQSRFDLSDLVDMDDSSLFKIGQDVVQSASINSKCDLLKDNETSNSNRDLLNDYEASNSSRNLSKNNYVNSKNAKENEEVMKPVLSQKTRTRNFLQRFKFVPRIEDESTSILNKEDSLKSKPEESLTNKEQESLRTTPQEKSFRNKPEKESYGSNSEEEFFRRKPEEEVLRSKPEKKFFRYKHEKESFRSNLEEELFRSQSKKNFLRNKPEKESFGSNSEEEFFTSKSQVESCGSKSEEFLESTPEECFRSKSKESLRSNSEGILNSKFDYIIGKAGQSTQKSIFESSIHDDLDLDI